MKKIIILLTFISSAYGATFESLQVDSTFQNSNCEANSSCSLKSFRLLVHDIKVTGSFGTNYTTRAFMSYQTDAVSNLDKYGVVQFIRGCQWKSKSNGDIHFNISREFFGDIVPFRHGEWVVDSVDVDPLYNSTEGPDFSRHAAYRYNSVIDSFDRSSESYYYKGGVVHPRLYVKDMPGTAFYDIDWGDAKNISLEFLSCIYKIDDIPVESSPKGMSPDDAIACYSWKSSNVFDHKSKKFISLDSISPVCGPFNLD